MAKPVEQNQLSAMRHSLAHIMAAAVQKLYPEAKFGVGPVIEDGFYYDIDLGKKTLSSEDLSVIEAEMQQIIKANTQFERYELTLKEAMAWAKKYKQPYKLELLKDLEAHGTTAIKNLDAAELIEKNVDKISTVSFYRLGDFEDLCRGPHLKTAGAAGAFKLHKLAGAYWRGNEKNPQLTRIYGAAFATQKELDEYFRLLAEARKRDHRKIGQELDLFTISDLVGPGLPLFTPRGTVLRKGLSDFSQSLQAQYGFERVWTPHIAREELYKVSGHYDKFPERFSVTSVESDDVFLLKPMNCPHHIQLFARKQWSYRDLPARYMENTTNYRDEKSGELHGLSRVRSISQDDGHVFCREEDIATELSSLVKMVKAMYKALAMDFYARLSYRDESEAYLGDPKLWKKAEAAIAEVSKQENLDGIEEIGEAAFYGPKIDFMVKDSLGREWQCATIQLDFVQPERFNLEYIDASGEAKRPVMIHKALLGSLERFLSVYIEHTAGNFPVWLAPEQVRLLSVNDSKEIMEYVQKLHQQLLAAGIRATVDSSNESVGKKIRNAELMKVPYSLVIGEKEAKSNKFIPRIRKDIAPQASEAEISLEKLVSSIVNSAGPGT